jgi:hypothetical protein
LGRPGLRATREKFNFAGDQVPRVVEGVAAVVEGVAAVVEGVAAVVEGVAAVVVVGGIAGMSRPKICSPRHTSVGLDSDLRAALGRVSTGACSLVFVGAAFPLSVVSVGAAFPSGAAFPLVPGLSVGADADAGSACVCGFFAGPLPVVVGCNCFVEGVAVSFIHRVKCPHRCLRGHRPMDKSEVVIDGW